MSAVLRVAGLSKRFGGIPALEQVSFQLHEGEAVGYLGPNGAGKTTTLRIICGLTGADSGTVEILGEDARDRSGSARRHLGALVESPGIIPFVTGRDLLRYVAEVRGGHRPEGAAQAVQSARLLSVEDQLDKPMGALSTGTVRRVLIAAALVGEPKLLLLDEPTLGLDPIARQDLRRVLRTLRDSGRTLLISTHLIEDVVEVCDRVLFLREGHLVGDEPVRRDRASDGNGGTTTLCLRFAQPVDPAVVTPLVHRATPVGVGPTRELRVELEGGEPAQAELLRALVRAGLPLASAEPVGSRLDQRYLELVGREEAG